MEALRKSLRSDRSGTLRVRMQGIVWEYRPASLGGAWKAVGLDWLSA